MSDDVETDTADDSGWEGLNLSGRRFAVFPDEAYFSADPLAIFADRDEAELWLKDYRTRMELGESSEISILEVDGLSGWCWNSYEDAPEEAPASDVPDLQAELRDQREKHEVQLRRFAAMAKTALEAIDQVWIAGGGQPRETIEVLARRLCETGPRAIKWDDARAELRAEYERIAELAIQCGADPRRLP